jgi:hypothetical protein
LLLDGDRVQMQEEIRQHHDDAVAAVNRHRMPKDAFPDLGFVDDLAQTRHNDFLPQTIRFRNIYERLPN